ncbi:epoxide hydrolase N-terminal domain-containing protein [Cupriavidus sp. 30B13]|uniref:epoxide hydrolase N-terminal domain-containing protein n=1 Tax=Cupriavidus sp. 30B13 TaxID=3384241 RepID=UPI003B906EB4
MILRCPVYPQFKTEIDDLGIHFLHIRSKHQDAMPLIMTHDWPSSIVEFLETIDPLINSTAHGGTSKDASHIVLPSLAGYGFSDKTRFPARSYHQGTGCSRQGQR